MPPRATAMLFLPPFPPLQLQAGERVTVGRSRSCELVLRSPDASRRHAEIAPEGDGWRVRDLDSTNGTYVNGARIETARLASGDRLKVGRVELVATHEKDS